MLRIKVVKKGNTEEGEWFELPLWIDEIYEVLEVNEEQYHAEYVISALDCDEIDGLKITDIDADALEDLNELAEQFVDEGVFGDTRAMGDLVNYIDYEALGRDLGHDGYIETSKGVLLVD